jgi:hypothetical protein
MVRFVIPILVLGATVMFATVLGSIAHYGLGIARGAIRIDALAGAGFIALALAGDAFLTRNK